METLLGAAYRDLLNISWISNVMVQAISIWIVLTRSTKYWQVLELQEHLDRTAYALRVNLPVVATPSLLNKVATIGVRMRNPDDLTRGIQPIILGQHNASRRKMRQ